ncbi:MAG TPA: SagB/ThcOx family dehydrogenase [Candidatus Paceibacterota bacterium]
MYVDFSALFHASSKDLNDKGRVYIPQDASAWPDEWKTTYYKSYARSPKIQLEKPRALGMTLDDILKKRISTRSFAGTPVDLKALSGLLFHSCGISNGENHEWGRMYPSGGARFPIEIYPIVFVGGKDIPAGLYHYNVKEHALDVLWKRAFSKKEIDEMFVYPWVEHASFAIIMTAVFGRNQMKYGERGYRYVLLEAGHMSENVYLAATALGVGCCAMGGTQDKQIERLLDIDGITESVIHSLVLGEVGSAKRAIIPA